MLKRLLAAAFAVVAVCTFAQPIVGDAHIAGHVIDAETGEHIPYYLVQIKDIRLGTMTDDSGHYILSDLKPGTYSVEASCIGFKTQTKTVTVSAGQTYELNFEAVPDAFMLDQVVVTSSKSDQVRRLSPSLVNVTPGKIFDAIGACSLADGLSLQPGVRVENDCQNCGFTQVRINGLDGHYSQILMNSRPVFSALAGVYGLEHIPANMIERVEVMRGGGSALFGSSAVGGTINIITRDPVANSARVTHQISSIGVSGDLDNNTTMNASVVSDNNRAGIFIFGQSRSRDGYDHDGDGFTEVTQLKSQTLGARAFFRPGDASRLSVEYHNTHEYRRGGDNLKEPAHMAMVAEQADHNIHAFEATLDLWPRNHADHVALFAATQSTRRTSYYGSEMDPDAYGRTSDVVVNAGAQWTHPFSYLLFMPSELVCGADYSFNRLHDVTVGYDHNLKQNVNIYSAFLQNEWRDERWGFLVGARVDKHSLLDNAVVSPRANIRFNPAESVNLRASYSTGFRAPQTYDEDLHVAIVGGDRVVTILAPGLKQESSNSFSLSGDFYHRFGHVQTNLLIEGFYTDLRDVFALRRLEEADAAGNAVLERYNGSGARVFGMNIEAKAYFSSHFDVQAGVTLQSSRYKQPEAWSDDPSVPSVKRMFRTPDVYGYFTANWEITHSLKAVLSGTLTGPMTVQHIAGSGTDVDVAKRTPTFFDMSVKLSYTRRLFGHVNCEFGLGAFNVFDSYQDDFDQGYLRDSGYVYGPSLPRSLTASVAVSI